MYARINSIVVQPDFILIHVCMTNLSSPTWNRIFHVCMATNDVQGDDARLRDSGMRLLRDQPSPGAEGATVQFVHPASSGGVLVEISERPGEGQADLP